MRKYKQVPMIRAGKNSRIHPRDVKPPELTEAENVYLSRSDGVLTLRPDHDYALSSTLPSISDSLETYSTTGENDFINRAHYASRTKDTIVFSRFQPFYMNYTFGTKEDLSGSYSTGTVSGTSGSTTVT